MKCPTCKGTGEISSTLTIYTPPGVRQGLPIKMTQESIADEKWMKIRATMERAINPPVNEVRAGATPVFTLSAVIFIGQMLEYMEDGVTSADLQAEYDVPSFAPKIKTLQAACRAIHKNLHWKELIDSKKSLSTQLYTLTDRGRVFLGWIPRELLKTELIAHPDV